MSLIVALLFGSMLSATDPISVLSIFKEVEVDERLSVLVEGESLLNDGTAVALFQILLASAIGGSVGLVWGGGQFVLSVVGGALLGFALGYLVRKLTKRVDDAQVEITFTTILAYGAFLLARHLHLSGVIATVAAGLMIGNFAAKTGMSATLGRRAVRHRRRRRIPDRPGGAFFGSRLLRSSVFERFPSHRSRRPRSVRIHARSSCASVLGVPKEPRVGYGSFYLPGRSSTRQSRTAIVPGRFWTIQRIANEALAWLEG